jgi:hypothetical protein
MSSQRPCRRRLAQCTLPAPLPGTKRRGRSGDRVSRR